MPKAAPFAPLPAVEKLPLAVRKDIRDNYESMKEDFESTISELLGTEFHININPNELWAYHPSDNTNPFGGLMKDYVVGFVDGLKSFLSTYGDDGKTHFNEAVSQSELSVKVNEVGDNADSISADVKDGVFRILFNHKSLGARQSYLNRCILPAIDSVPRAGFTLAAQHSINEYYHPKIEEVTAAIAKTLAMPDVILDPNFEENFAALSVRKDTPDWHPMFGKASYEYFSDGLKYQLSRQEFESDEMLQEGLAEAIPSKTFKLRIVSKTKSGDTNEIVIEGGVAYIQTTPDKWWFSMSSAGKGLVNLL